MRFVAMTALITPRNFRRALNLCVVVCVVVYEGVCVLEYANGP